MTDPRFETTNWSLVLGTRSSDDPRAREALATLCESYWYPLYCFVRRQGFAADESLDLTQGYFAKLIERGFLGHVQPERGRFRSFLLASMRHHLAHVKRDERAAKRARTSDINSRIDRDGTSGVEAGAAPPSLETDGAAEAE